MGFQMTGPAVFPGADIRTRYWPNGGGVLQSSLDKLVLHSTETPGSAGCPGYSGGGTAPNLTLNPWPGHQKVYQHFRSVAMSAKALRDTGGFSENRDHVSQIEIVGYSDKKMGAKYGFFLPDLPQAGIDYLAKALVWYHLKWGIPMTTPHLWPAYPASYGKTSARMSTAAYDAYKGVLGHLHVPDSVHGDPTLDVAKLMAAVAAQLAAGEDTPPPVVVPPTIVPPKFPLLKGYYFGPKTGPKESISGYFSYPQAFKPWQKQVNTHGFKLVVDGRFDQADADVAKRVQKAKGLTVDGRVGPDTWAAAWKL
jgi:hypothetical protein